MTTPATDMFEVPGERLRELRRAEKRLSEVVAENERLRIELDALRSALRQVRDGHIPHLVQTCTDALTAPVVAAQPEDSR